MSFLVYRGGVNSAVGKSLFALAKIPSTLRTKAPSSSVKFEHPPSKEFIGGSTWDIHGQFNSKSHLSSTQVLSRMVFTPQKRRFSTVAKTSNEIPMIVELGADNSQSFKFQIPLPNKERILFSLKGETTVKGFLQNLKEEDSTIQNASIYAADGAKIAANTNFSDIVGKSFQIAVNNQRFTVTPAVGSVSGQVSLESSEFEQMKKEILPLYLEKRKIDQKATRSANLIIYGGLGYLVAQWAILARMTWWEFNWDIMEPVTYFITFGTAVLGYAYFALTKRDYTFMDLRESLATRRMYNKYIRGTFDLEKYYTLEYKLKQKDPEVLELLEAEAEEIARGSTQSTESK